LNILKKNSSFSDAIIIAFGNILNLFVQWALLAVLIRMYGYGDDAGYFSLVVSLANVFAIVSFYGLRAFQISDANNQFSDAVYINTRLVTCMAGFVLCIFYGFISQYSFKVLVLLAIYMLFRSLEAFTDVIHGIFQKNSRLSYSGISLIIKSVANFPAFIVVYFLTESIFWSLLSMLASSVLVLLVYDFHLAARFVSLKQSLATFSYQENQPLLKSGFFTMLAGALGGILWIIPRLVLEKYHSVQILGIFYSVVTPALIITSVTTYMLTPMVTRFSHLYADGLKKEFIHLMLKVLGLLALFGATCCLVAFFAGRFLLTLVYGEAVGEYAYIFNYLVVYTVLASFSVFMIMVFIIMRKLKSLNVILLSGCLLCLLFSLVSIPAHGMDGAAYSLIAAQAGCLLALAGGVAVFVRHFAD
jgi:O-antigen/teichoic acid export membrane protein